MLYYLRIYRQQIKKFREQELLCRAPMRYFSRWKNTIDGRSDSIRDEQPWITFEAIDFLKKEVHADHNVFEYGGGGSTLFFTKRAAEVVTVEHNREWYDTLEKIVSQKKIANWRGNFVPPEAGDVVPDPDPSNPFDYTSRDDDKGFNFKEYASVIDAYPDDYFHFVLVDGRARPSCISHAMPKIRRGWYLIVDNSDREYYFTQLKGLLEAQFELVSNNFGPSPYAKDFTRTAIWRKRR